jgi:hypothetical protein
VILLRNHFAAHHVATCDSVTQGLTQGATARAMQQILQLAETARLHRFRYLAPNLLFFSLRAGGGAMLGRGEPKRSGHRSTFTSNKLLTRRIPRCLKV